MDRDTQCQLLAQLTDELNSIMVGPVVPDIDRVGWTYQAYQANYRVLLLHIVNPHHDLAVAIETRVPGDAPEVYRSYQAEFFRLLLNYSASTSTLIDHTRILEQKLASANPEHHALLIKRRRSLSDTRVAHFIKGLRNFVLHRDLPTTTAQTRYSEDQGISFDTILITDDLLQWSNWDRSARQFLEDRDEISLSRVLAEYDSLVNQLYGFIFDQTLQIAFENASRRVNLEIDIAGLQRLSGRQDQDIK